MSHLLAFITVKKKKKIFLRYKSIRLLDQAGSSCSFFIPEIIHEMHVRYWCEQDSDYERGKEKEGDFVATLQ